MMDLHYSNFYELCQHFKASYKNCRIYNYQFCYDGFFQHYKTTNLGKYATSISGKVKDKYIDKYSLLMISIIYCSLNINRLFTLQLVKIIISHKLVQFIEFLEKKARKTMFVNFCGWARICVSDV